MLCTFKIHSSPYYHIFGICFSKLSIICRNGLELHIEEVVERTDFSAQAKEIDFYAFLYLRKKAI
jgi:hypothetical protein